MSRYRYLTGDAVHLILLALSLTALTAFYSITVLLREISSLSATDNGLGFSF